MEEKPHILVVDDEPSIRLALEAGLTVNGFRVTVARSGREALTKARETDFAAVLSDIYMPEGDGLEVVRELHASQPALPIILLTAQSSVELAVQAVAEGAADFVAKPFEVADLAALLRRHLEARRENEATAGATLPEDFSRTGLVGRSPAMASVYKLVAHAARTPATVLVLGESGTGKELIARAIHQFSPRAVQPFIAVNCSGLTDTLLESEFFGHAKGAFTGANQERGGLFEAADGGTLFLDELASTSAAFQASLLRALQQGEVRRVGATQARRVNARVIGASNAPLRQLVAAGSFRADLFYRLSVLSIELPPLRERNGDVGLLSGYFLQRLGQTAQKPLRLTDEAARVLAAHSFPGNVRELENALLSASAFASNGIITLDCLPHHIIETNTTTAGVLPAVHTRTTLFSDVDRPTMDELQRRYLRLVLSEVKGNRRHAAQVLGLNRRTIQRLIIRYGLIELAEEEEADSEDLA